ncbi:VOC family protein [Glaciimonas sp. CA11.2]|nr:VOC family protein [Glaciimonas sp. CA11.2]MDY7548818.1 VOC family protein [Glaciimonas sp. CA11.2]MEB0012465.1 VOC family protein [Glaciimonas sp. Cout2]MEB0082606.1 VOC family protein [Glaciimonas sp. Gout2]MEB0164817.1 VOC family protein [Glaciimonas sp. CA11.2]
MRQIAARYAPTTSEVKHAGSHFCFGQRHAAINRVLRKTLIPLGISHVIDYDGAKGPAGHPDLKGFGRDGRVFFWLRHGTADARAIHVGFVADSEPVVDTFYAAAIAAGATDNGKPGARLYYDPRYYAANVFDPDGYSLEAVYKSWQHP